MRMRLNKFSVVQFIKCSAIKFNPIKLSAIITTFITLVLILTAQADIVKQDKGKEAKFLRAITTLAIDVGVTKNIQARFNSLNKDGTDAGLDNIVINGTLNYKPTGNYQKVHIKWHSVENRIKKPKLINKVDFTKKPRSELTTDEKRISASQRVVIEVDEKSFMQALNRLNQGLTAAQVGQLTANNNNHANSNNSNQNSGLNNSGGTGSLSSNNGVQSQLPTLGDTADANSSVIEQCDYRYDVDNMIAHEQQRINQVNQEGVITEQGACLDTTKTFELVKTYGAPCSVFITTDKAYQSYRITGVIEGEDKIINGCQADLDNEIIITKTAQGCNTSDNINTRVATATYRKYYMLGGTEIEVQQCLADENSQTFAIQEAVCSYGVVSVNGYSIPQTKLYYTNDLGVEVPVRGCQASPTQQFATQKIDCEGTNRYEHDSASATSYLMQKTFVVDTISGSEEQVNDCQRSNYQFAHQQESCSTIHDDDNLRLLRPKRDYFVDTTLADIDINADSRLYLSSCDEGVADATPYFETTTDTATTYVRGDGSSYGHCIIGGNYGADGSSCVVYGSGTVLYEAYAGGSWYSTSSVSNDVTFASIPSSVLSLVDPTKRLKIVAIAGGGATKSMQSHSVSDSFGGGYTYFEVSDVGGYWGQMTSAYYTNPMTTININIGNGSSACVKGGNTTIGSMVSLTGGKARCDNATSISGYLGTSGIPNLHAGSPGLIQTGCNSCYSAGADGYVRIEVE